MRTSWLNFSEDMKKEARRKCWTLRRIFRNLAAHPTRKDWPKTLSLRGILGKLSSEKLKKTYNPMDPHKVDP